MCAACAVLLLYAVHFKIYLQSIMLALTEISYTKIRKEEGQTLLRSTQSSTGVPTQFGPKHHSVSIISCAECFCPIRGDSVLFAHL